MDNEQLKRIADILEEILRIIKKDMGNKFCIKQKVDKQNKYFFEHLTIL